MGGRLDLLVNGEDLPVDADDEGPTTGNVALGVDDTVRGGDLAVRVAEDRIVELQRLGEFAILLRLVATGGEVGQVEFAERLAVLTERLALGRSAPGERQREPGDHHRPFAAIALKRIRLAVAAGQLEVRRGIARLQLDRRSRRCHEQCRHGGDDDLSNNLT